MPSHAFIKVNVMFSSFDFSKLAAHRIEMEFHNQGILICMMLAYSAITQWVLRNIEQVCP